MALLVQPVPGPATSVRVVCTGCPAFVVISCFPAPVVARLVERLEAEHVEECPWSAMPLSA
jgi:hypothetical protein